jgi:hypothetical protein
METITLQNNAYKYAVSGNSLFDKLVKLYRENSAAIICGLLSLNGSTNAYQLYNILNK